jgi:hypothetical protein
MSQRPPSPAYVLGVGLTKLIKARGKVEYTELGFEVRLPLLCPFPLPTTFPVSPSLTLLSLGRHQNPPRRPAKLRLRRPRHRLLLQRRLQLGPTRLLPTRHDGHPHLQRQ